MKKEFINDKGDVKRFKSAPSKELLVRCSCACGVLGLIQWEDHDDLYVSIYLSNPNLSWRERFRWIWHLVRGKKPFDDELIIDADGLARLKKYFKDLK
jgi:hypothetical protein